MDETKKISLDEVLDNKPMYDNLGQNIGTPDEYAMHLRSVKGDLYDHLDKAQETPECIALSMNEDKDTIKKIVSEQGYLRGHPSFEVKKKTTIEVFNVQPEEEVYVEMMKLSGLVGKTDHISKVLNRCNHGKREYAYPELPKGKLLYKHEENHDAEASFMSWPNKRLFAPGCCKTASEELAQRLCNRLSKRLKVDKIKFSHNKLMINETMTKFDIQDITGAIESLARVIPAKEAERLVVREIAKKIQNVL